VREGAAPAQVLVTAKHGRGVRRSQIAENSQITRDDRVERSMRDLANDIAKGDLLQGMRRR
jgi:hypothetical protein